MSSNNYFSRRWHGQVPVAILFWRDMLGVGTLINLTATALALTMIIHGIHAGLAVAVHFAPLPFNIFLLAVINRAPDRSPIVLAMAGLWLAAMTLV